MAVRGKSSKSTRSKSRSLVAPVTADSLASSGPLRLPGGQGPWTYMVSPAQLTCRNGRIVPLPAKAWHAPGLNGNGRSRGRGEGFVSYLSGQGYVPVPHDRPAVAFGIERTTPDPSTYLDVYDGIGPSGEPVEYYCDAWRRPHTLGHTLRWEADEQGRDEWLAGLVDLIGMDGKWSDDQIAIAIDPVVTKARSLLDRDDPRGKRMLAIAVRHLPAEHVPDDLKAAYREATAKK